MLILLSDCCCLHTSVWLSEMLNFDGFWTRELNLIQSNLSSSVKGNSILKLVPLSLNLPLQCNFPWKSHETWQPSSCSWRWAGACGPEGSHRPDETPHLKPGWEKSIHLVECHRIPSYRGGKTDKADIQTYTQADRRPDRHTQRHRHR